MSSFKTEIKPAKIGLILSGLALLVFAYFQFPRATGPTSFAEGTVLQLGEAVELTKEELVTPQNSYFALELEFVTTAQNAQGNPYSVVTLIHRPAYGQGSQRIRLKTDSAQNKHTEILDANRTYT
ncbi:MAG: hypothetical protein AAGD96_17930, partial [Chloroflexota bacterium]